MRRNSGQVLRPCSGQAAIIFILVIALIFLFTAITVNVGKVAELKNNLSVTADGAATNLAASLGSYSGLLKEKGDSATGWDIGYIFNQILGVEEIIRGALTGNPEALLRGIALLGGNTVSQVLVGLEMGSINRKLVAAGLDLKDLLREQAIQYALVRVVDDPKMVQDTFDIDEDGDRDEQVSRFAVQYYARTNNIASDLGEMNNPLLSYLEGFQSSLENFSDKMVDFSVFLEGEFIPLLKELKDREFAVSFWEEGVDWDRMGEENPAPENDDIDRLRYIINYSGNEDMLETFVTDTVENLDDGVLIVGEVFRLWNQRLYDPEDNNNDDWYSLFGRYSTTMDAWLLELRDKKSGLEEILLTKQERMNYLQRRIEEIEGEGREINEQIAKLHLEIDKLNEQIAELHLEIDKLNEQIADKKEEIAEVWNPEVIYMLERKLEVLEEELAALEEELAELQTQLELAAPEEELAELQTQLAVLAEERSRRLIQLADIQRQIATLDYLVDRVEYCIKRIKSANNPMTGSIQKFRAAVDGLETVIEGNFTSKGEAIAVNYNPVTYSWHDSRGNHFVRVYVHGFHMPELDIDTHWYGKTDYTLYDAQGECGVEITRFDEGQDTYLWNFRYTKDAEAGISDPVEAGFDLPGAEAAVEHGISATATRNYYCGGCSSN